MKLLHLKINRWRNFEGVVFDIAPSANLTQREATHHLYLDSDRAYPPLEIHNAHYAEALQRQWNSRDWRKNRAYMPTRFLYDDWVKYFHALESQQATQYVEAIRSARELGQPQPEFADPFVEFKASVEKVLPHLKFRGVDRKAHPVALGRGGGNRTR